MDFKLMDDEKHKFYTGVSNELTRKNLCRLNEVSVDVVVRIPTTGGVNSDEENIRRSVAYVHAALPKAKMELLAYHRLAPSNTRHWACPMSTMRFTDRPRQRWNG